jgi:hypothetical protein
MNKLEGAYKDSLEMQARAGEIQSYMFEPVKLRLAPATTYTPDFMVIAANDIVELHEVKGFWEDDARVKIKVAAEMFPMFLFKAYTRKKGMWIEESF